MHAMVYVFVLLALVLGFEALREIWAGREAVRRSKARRRLRELADRIGSVDAGDEPSLLRSDGRASGALERLLGRLPGHAKLRLRLYRAGLTIPVERFVMLSVLLGVGGFLTGLVFVGDVRVAWVLLGLGLVPWMNAGRVAERRRNAFEQQFPDALDLLIRALRAGHSLTSGFLMVAKEMSDPIATEFAQLADEIQLGKPTREALANLAHRIDSPDLPFFVTAVMIQQETGSNLAEVLDNLCGVMRERFKVLGKVRALTAMGRASAAVLAAWPFVTVALLYVVNPGYIEPLWAEPAGHTMVLVSLLMVGVGYVLCRKMATIRV